MAPADLRKEGSAYDLSIAVGILAASSQINYDGIDDYLIMGELSLDGSLQPIKGAYLSLSKPEKKDSKVLSYPNKMLKKQLSSISLIFTVSITFQK